MINDPAPKLYRRTSELLLLQSADMKPALERLANTRPPGSAADRDYKTLLAMVRSGPRKDLWARAMIFSFHMVVNATDQLRSVGVLLSDPPDVPLYSPMALCRLGIESAARISRLIDVNVPFSTRFARGVGLLIADADSAARAAEEVPAQVWLAAPGPPKRAQYDKLLQKITDAKIQITYGKKGPARVSVDNGKTSEEIAIRVSEELERRFPKMPAVYAFGSGITHSSAWMLGDVLDFDGRRAFWNPDPIANAGAGVVLLTAAHAILGDYAAYAGAPDDPSVTAAKTRCVQLDKAMSEYCRVTGQVPRPRPGILLKQQ